MKMFIIVFVAMVTFAGSIDLAGAEEISCREYGDVVVTNKAGDKIDDAEWASFNTVSKKWRIWEISLKGTPIFKEYDPSKIRLWTMDGELYIEGVDSFKGGKHFSRAVQCKVHKTYGNSVSEVNRNLRLVGLLR